jgi:hypothetical protein
MAGVTTNAVAVAIVALLSVLVTSVRSAENYDTSLAKSYSSGWLAAKATWYGPPTGAGPEDNGKLHIRRRRNVLLQHAAQPCSNNAARSVFRWCLRLQEREQVPLLLHDVLRQ